MFCYIHVILKKKEYILCIYSILCICGFVKDMGSEMFILIFVSLPCLSCRGSETAILFSVL